MPFTLQNRHLEGSKASPEPGIDLPSPEPATELGGRRGPGGPGGRKFFNFPPRAPCSHPTSTLQVPGKLSVPAGEIFAIFRAARCRRPAGTVGNFLKFRSSGFPLTLRNRSCILYGHACSGRNDTGRNSSRWDGPHSCILVRTFLEGGYRLPQRDRRGSRPRDERGY